MEVVCYGDMWFQGSHDPSRITTKVWQMSICTMYFVEMEKVHLRNDGYFWHVCVAPRALCFRDFNMEAFSDMYFILFYFTIVGFIFPYIMAVFRHVCGPLDIWQPNFTYGKKQWLFSTCVWACVSDTQLEKIRTEKKKTQSDSREIKIETQRDQ